MAKKKVLFQWIGYSDLRSLAATLPAAEREEILKRTGGEAAKPGDVGPIKTLLQTQTFDAVRLLSNFRAGWNTKYLKWLGHPADVVRVELDKPTDYPAIFSIADAELGKIRKQADWQDLELCLHLSPGTPAMAAVWLLLGKTRYPATFYETYGGKSWITEVPFDITIDVIPEIFRDPDVHLQHLAAQSPSELEGFQDIIGESRVIRDAVGRAQRAAIRGVSVLLLGESGSGKEMFAQAIHRASPRRDKHFIAINCAALPKSLLESELFGHCKGAFTDAKSARKGAFESADGGTLFLDEIGECDPEIQAKLLRVLQPIPGKGSCTRLIRRLGDEKGRQVDVRIIAATNRDPHRAVADRVLREDLYYRLAAFTITLPPLRNRQSDIPMVAEYMLTLINTQFAAEEPGYQYKSLSAPAIAFMKKHEWPGNVRQLQNVLVQAAVLAEGNTVNPGDLKAALGEMPQSAAFQNAMERPLGGDFSLEEHLNTIQRHYLRRAMEEARGVKAKAARLLGIKNYQTLDGQLERLKVQGNWRA